MMSIQLTGLLAIAAFLASCSVIRHGDDGGLSRIAELPPPYAEAGIIEQACNYHQDHCDNLWSPSLCLLPTYSRQDLGHEHALFHWGDNPCLAAQGLRQQFCDLKWEERRAENAICIPDPSQGECQDPSKILQGCREEGPVTRMYCHAGSYEGQELAQDQVIPGWGEGRCAATADARRRACRLQLRPGGLGPLTCVRDATEGSCPAIWELCPDGTDQHHCRIEVKGQVIVAEGRNLCTARNWLRYKLCQRNIRPTLISSATCQRKPR